ncbi:hypothetical protein QR680_010475 [Steinernema hermaphroditum]|uniref:Peptidase M13 C-terminal domain-containing protein n=1 Tax=Steinernema hermaphroditum TaxID=289476 RepID=A0AA39IQY8_9BILA|nr:hypothetical protein QR680_010475 [Steinernema hermaphroditum]
MYCGVLLFFLTFLKIDASVFSTQAELARSFNESVRPCDNLHGHVCVGRAVEKFTLRAQYGLAMDISKILNARREKEPVTKLILEAITKQAHLKKGDLKKCRLHGYSISEEDVTSQDNDYKMGDVLGQMIAAGRVDDPDVINIACRDMTPGYPCVWTLSAEKKKYEAGFAPLDAIESDFVRGVMTGFLRTLAIPMDPKYSVVAYRKIPSEDFKKVVLAETYWEGFHSTVKYIAHHLHDQSDRAEFGRTRQIYLLPTIFGGYGNVLFAHTFYSNKDKLNPGVIGEFKRLVNMVRKEILDTIKSSEWMSTNQRKMLEAYVESIEVSSGVPTKYQNISLLEEMLEVYRGEFNKVDMDGDCALEMMSRAHAIARQSLIHTGYGTVNEFSKMEPSEHSIFDNNAAQLGDKIIFNPGGLHVLNERLFFEFKLAFVGWTIAHEMFHGLGLLKSSVVQKYHMERIVDIPHYEEAEKCYVDFYGQKQFCIKADLCPKGLMKADEGFADVEAARVVYKILQKLPSKRKGASEAANLSKSLEENVLIRDKDPLSVRQWFFFALQLKSCVVGEKYVGKKRALREPHPRNEIRGNAIAQQMREFTETFQCGAGDRNVVVDEPCALYTPLGTGPDILPAEPLSLMAPRVTSGAPFHLASIMISMCTLVYNVFTA